ncbi:MAG: hypothetical protein WCF26_08215 [Candidatus Sulfotelmatobacter sp.]
MTEIEKLFLTLAVTLTGSGLGTTIVAALFKRRFDAQLETHKAFLLRNSKIHERQVDALLAIHSKLELGLFNLQRAAGPGKVQGEADDKELLRRMAVDLGAASEVFSQNKLLIGPDLTRKLDEFFNTVSAGIHLNMAANPMIPDGQTRAGFIDKARATAFKELPSILEAIRAEARAVIHN